jgi:hypothetical protein
MCFGMNETHRLRREDISDIVARRCAIMMEFSVFIDPEIEIANRLISPINNPVLVGTLYGWRITANRVMLMSDDRGFHSVVVYADRLVSITSAA